MSRALTLVATQPTETAGQRAAEAMAVARHCAAEHIEEMRAAWVQAELVAFEVSNSGDAYPAGIRDLAGRQALQLRSMIDTLEALIARVEKSR